MCAYPSSLLFLEQASPSCRSAISTLAAEHRSDGSAVQPDTMSTQQMCAEDRVYVMCEGPRPMQAIAFSRRSSPRCVAVLRACAREETLFSRERPLTPSHREVEVIVIRIEMRSMPSLVSWYAWCKVYLLYGVLIGPNCGSPFKPETNPAVLGRLY